VIVWIFRGHNEFVDRGIDFVQFADLRRQKSGNELGARMADVSDNECKVVLGFGLRNVGESFRRETNAESGHVKESNGQNDSF
jgi:hypothetical protein